MTAIFWQLTCLTTLLGRLDAAKDRRLSAETADNQQLVDRDVLRQTILSMMQFDDEPAINSSNSLANKAMNSYMRQLYRTFIEDDGSDDGNTVRAIPAGIAKYREHQVLVFDISDLGQETMQRAELHFTLKKPDSSRKRSKGIRARTVCLNEYCREQGMKKIPSNSDEEVVWDATKAAFESVHLGATQIAFRITRDRLRMKPYHEMIRWSQPFLLIYAQGDNTIDANKVKEKVEIVKRRRRQLGYYGYESRSKAEDASLQEPDAESESISQENLNGYKIRATNRRVKSGEFDLWAGFGEPEETKENDEIGEKKNDIRVVLLNEEQKKGCEKYTETVDMKELGLDNIIQYPAFMESGRCEGSCQLPLKKVKNYHFQKCIKIDFHEANP
ncbi:hypothetical protein WR25_24787 isoform D [Diploscapter pachys]|uniref:TGF-beta family profile domain-containing protein n=1 Tax=Diploscapter pachys TaxID=2018661 RepID=A0A2A2KK22_9BILA|nr:hypothetical protein WR25_24787 isoform B [Diploscapter pachys]PAV74215.1 hypothetical protein WR25_24787 isoform D [Diploscapter pachys]